MYNSFKSILHFGIILMLLTTFLACNKKREDPKPENLIPKEKMSAILKDVHMAEASLQMFPSTERDSIGRGYYGHIFRIHEVEEDRYYKSIEYYTSSPQDLIDIYVVTNELLQKKKEDNKAMEK